MMSRSPFQHSPCWDAGIPNYEMEADFDTPKLPGLKAAIPVEQH